MEERLIKGFYFGKSWQTAWSNTNQRLFHFSSSENTIPMPGCHMKIFTGEKLAENVKIGDPLTLSISLDKQDLYGLHITDCIVRDGLGWGEQTLVNKEG
jgi:hypothetical protein